MRYTRPKQPYPSRQAMICLLATLVVVPVDRSWGQGATMPDPEGAASALTRMRDHLRNSTELQFTTSIKVVSSLRAGEVRATAEFTTQQPNRFRVEVKSGRKSYTVVSDGKRVTIYKPATKKYAQFPTRQTMLGSMYTAAGLMNIAGRMLDFFWAVDAGFDLKVESLPDIKVDGQDCRGIRVERFEEIFEVWLDPTSTPRPCKLINRRSDGAATAEQTTLFKWVSKPVLSTEAFSFDPPKGSRQVDPIDLE